MRIPPNSQFLTTFVSLMQLAKPSRLADEMLDARRLSNARGGHLEKMAERVARATEGEETQGELCAATPLSKTAHRRGDLSSNGASLQCRWFRGPGGTFLS